MIAVYSSCQDIIKKVNILLQRQIYKIRIYYAKFYSDVDGTVLIHDFIPVLDKFELSI